MKLNINLPPNIGQRDFDEWASQLTQYIRDFLGTTDWVAITAFSNSWENFGGTYLNAAYCKDGNGFVHIRGVIKSGTNETTAFTLPAGYRPTSDTIFAVNETGPSHARVIVYSDGKVEPKSAAGTSVSISLDGINFYAG
jgi:hypothetical protein